jgi:hypothetical protein
MSRPSLTTGEQLITAFTYSIELTLRYGELVEKTGQPPVQLAS